MVGTLDPEGSSKETMGGLSSGIIYMPYTLNLFSRVGVGLECMSSQSGISSYLLLKAKDQVWFPSLPSPSYIAILKIG
jgi:hypothetical protein